MLLSFFVGLLTVILVLDCLFLLLLILIQLPKKEAGLGQAFGSGATDALFGAGSGTALTKMTKYSAAIFFVLTFLLAILNAQISKDKRGGQRLRSALEAAQKVAATQQPPAAVTSPGTNVTPKINITPPPKLEEPATNVLKSASNAAAAVVMTNLPPVVLTNKPAATTPAVPAATNKPAAANPAPAAATNKPAAPPSK
jgi:preprotein translocase subunit SecG